MASIGLSLTVSEVPFISRSHVRLNLKNPRETLKFQSASNRNLVNIEYIRAPAITSTANVFINDRSFNLRSNQIFDIDNVIEFTSISTNLSTQDFLVTDIFTTGSSTVTPAALFYKHTVSNKAFISSAGDSITNIELLSTNQSIIKLQESKFDLTKGIIYFNEKNSFDTITGQIDIRYVRFSVKKSDGTTKAYTEILNPQPVFHQATFADLDDFGKLAVDSSAYLIEKVVNNFVLTLPYPLRKFAIKELSQTKLKIEPPRNTSVKDPWFVSVRNGDVLQNLSTISGQDIRRFRIAEFNSQSFAPYSPHKTVNRINARILNEHTIQLLHTNIGTDSLENLIIRLYIKDEDGNLKLALSNDLNDQGLRAGLDKTGNWITFTGGVGYNEDNKLLEKSGIRSIDSLGGFIDILDILFTTDTVEATYSYKETLYEFSTINLNPIYNRDILNQNIVLYIKPETDTSLSKSLFYAIVDKETGYVIDTDDTDTVISGINIKNLISQQRLSYTTSSGIEYSLVRDASIESQSLVPFNIINDNQYLILGDVSVGEITAPQDLALFDVRIEGGAIKPEVILEKKELKSINTLFWNGGRWDGLPYPGMASMMVEIPLSIDSDHNGRFTPQQTRDIVETHIAAGTYPIIKHYGIDPIITDATAVTSGFKITWSDNRSDLFYNIYYHVQPAGQFTLANITPLAAASPNILTVSGLTPKLPYYIYLDSLDAAGTVLGSSKTIVITIV